MNQKGFALTYFILISMIAVVLIGGAYYFGIKSAKDKEGKIPIKVGQKYVMVAPISPRPVPSPSPADPYLEWSSSDNSKYGVTFKYPENFVVNELEYTNADLYSLRISTKPQVTPPMQYLTTTTNIVINKSSDKDKSDGVGGYKLTSNIFNTFTNYIGEEDLLVGKIIDIKNGFATKSGERMINGVRFVTYSIQPKEGATQVGWGLSARHENKTINIIVYDKSDGEQSAKIDLILYSLKISF